MLLVSSCLIGLKTRYDGNTNLSERIRELVELGGAIPVCPEQLGGLATPRLSAEFRGGDGDDVLEGRARLVNTDDEDVTAYFLRGAEETLAIAKMVGARRAIFKERSPSCGCRQVWIDGKLAEGCGVTSALLKRNGIRVQSDEAWLSEE